MRILTIGKGAREHAIVARLAQSGNHDLYASPGNPGIAQFAQLHNNVTPTNPRQVRLLAEKLRADLVVVGPEEPLCAGVADELRLAGLPTVGPSASAASIEGAKSFGKRVCALGNIPTAKWGCFRDFGQAKNFVLASDFEVVLKTDGLAAGKGVAVTHSKEEAVNLLRDYQFDGYFEAGKTLLIEERLEGPEVSAHAFTDGETIAQLPFSCDYKRLLDGNVGPNTGGMGAYCPVPWLEAELASQIELDITTSALQTLALNLNRPFRGIFYPGVMITHQGPKVLEFNARFGDPEVCVILPLAQFDLAEVLLALAKGELHKVKEQVRWSDQFAVAVVLTSEGYPEEPITGQEIRGLEEVDSDVSVFHAGTKLLDGKLLTAGGRVLTLVAKGTSLIEARERVYDNVKRIHFDGMHYRTDIAQER